MTKRDLRIRDPIHGIIHFSEIEEAVMNTWLMQRLRGIKQLALTEYVYPGCKHSRFEHSIGTMHIAGRIAEKTGLEPAEVDAVRLAALLHDVGHGPFSHVSEEALRTLSSYPERSDGPGELHEELTVALIRNDEDLRAILGEEVISRIASLIDHGHSRTLQADIVSGPLDADKLDYLLRDSYYAGVEYGRFDLERIVDESVCVGDRENLGFREGAIWALEQLLLARYHMFTQVYNHRVRAITDEMTVRGVVLAAHGDPAIKRLFRYDRTPEFRSRWLSLDDEELFRQVLVCQSAAARRVFRDLRERRLYKRAVSIDLAGDVHDIRLRERLLSLEGERKAEVERTVANSLSLAPEEVILKVRSMSNPAFKGERLRVDPDNILIVRDSGAVESFAKHPDVIRIAPETERQFVEVYIPVHITCLRGRKTFLSQVRKRLTGMLLEAVS